MSPSRLFALSVPLLGLVWLGCAATGDTRRPPEKSLADQWTDLMVDTIGPTYETLREDAERAPRDVDLGKLAADARDVARHMALGYGRFDLKDIKGFADYARATEAWLLEIALAADGGDHAKVRKLALMDAEHCDACHKAAERK